MSDHEKSAAQKSAEAHVRESAAHLHVCEIICDTLEGIYDQKRKPSEEWNLAWQ